MFNRDPRLRVYQRHWAHSPAMDHSLHVAIRDSKPHWGLGHCVYNSLEQGQYLSPPLLEESRSGVHGRPEVSQPDHTVLTGDSKQ